MTREQVREQSHYSVKTWSARVGVRISTDQGAEQEIQGGRNKHVERRRGNLATFAAAINDCTATLQRVNTRDDGVLVVFVPQYGAVGAHDAVVRDSQLGLVGEE